MRRPSFIPLLLWLLLPGSAALAQQAGPQLPAEISAAIDAKDWRKAADLLGPLLASTPSWRGYEAMGDAEMQLKLYPEAIVAFAQGVTMASGDPAARPSVRRMLIGEGNAKLVLHDTAAAIALYRQEAAEDPSPGLAEFNICAVEYNTAMTTEALGDCDRAIAADPAKADAFFIKGSILFADTTQVDGKWVVPPGALEALRKYLELAPDGPHAPDVKQMLDMVK